MGEGNRSISAALPISPVWPEGNCKWDLRELSLKPTESRKAPSASRHMVCQNQRVLQDPTGDTAIQQLPNSTLSPTWQFPLLGASIRGGSTISDTKRYLCSQLLTDQAEDKPPAPASQPQSHTVLAAAILANSGSFPLTVPMNTSCFYLSNQ